MQRLLQSMPMITCVIPIVANIVLAIMAAYMHNWMMLAMMIPSIMIYVASLIPTIVQLSSRSNTAPEKDKDIATLWQARQLEHTQEDERITALTRIAPQSLESLLLGNTPAYDACMRHMPPWRNIVYCWLQHANDNHHLSASFANTTQGALTIDICQQGPHSLIAGTTGSGKSVLLRSWCLSLACNYSPTQLRFIFMDFKGGSTFSTLASLPHTIGNVDDLNIAHAKRALQAIEQELHRREQLVARANVSDIHQLTHPEPSILIVIDEFNALRNQLPDYMNRLNHLASMGRSLGMYLIVCTQNPLGQVNTDMKANLAINICLRVRDSMQSQELIGSNEACRIPPTLKGAAYINTGESCIPIRASACTNPQLIVKAISIANQFCNYPPAYTLFSAPLASCVNLQQCQAYDDNQEHATAWQHHKHSICIGLQDDGIYVSRAMLPLTLGNIAIIGGRRRGKTQLLCLISHLLHQKIFDAQTEFDESSRATSAMHQTPPHYVFDNADLLVEPFSKHPLAAAFVDELHRNTISIFALQSARHLHIPDDAPVRIVFPTGDAATDSMLGIPSEVRASFDEHDYQCPGRAVLITPGKARRIQIAQIDTIM